MNGSGDYLTAGNWVGDAIPGSADQARINWNNNLVTLGGTAPDVQNLKTGVNESGTLEINNNGSLTSTGWSMIGTKSEDVTDKLIVDEGGEFTTATHLWVGVAANNTGIVEINGGTVNVGQMIGLGTVNAVEPSAGIGIVNVNDGGLLALSNIHANGTSIHPGSVLNINGTGQVTLPGNFVNVINAYIDAGYITGNDVSGPEALIVDTTTNEGFTTITAQEVVEPNDEALVISTINLDQGTGEIEFSWNSLEGERFKIDFSTDLSNWGNDLEESYEADPGTLTTYRTNRSNLLGAEDAPRVYFRVERIISTP